MNHLKVQTIITLITIIMSNQFKIIEDKNIQLHTSSRIIRIKTNTLDNTLSDVRSLYLGRFLLSCIGDDKWNESIAFDNISTREYALIKNSFTSTCIKIDICSSYAIERAKLESFKGNSDYYEDAKDEFEEEYLELGVETEENRAKLKASIDRMKNENGGYFSYRLIEPGPLEMYYHDRYIDYGGHPFQELQERYGGKTVLLFDAFEQLENDGISKIAKLFESSTTVKRIIFAIVEPYA